MYTGSCILKPLLNYKISDQLKLKALADGRVNMANLIIFQILLPIKKNLDWSKSKAFADDKIKLARLIIFVFDRVENIVVKGENAGCQHFLLFLQCFHNTFCLVSLM